MSGPKQHYIPQFLLRSFGKKGKGKSVQVSVYASDGRVFVAATEGVGAQKFFYSNPVEDDGSETLDDKITAYESQLALAFSEIRSTPPGEIVDAEKVAEIVAHLCVRQAHPRKSFASAAGQLFEGIEGVVTDKDLTRKVLGLEGSIPTGIARQELDKAFEQYRPILEQMGLTKSEFDRRAQAMFEQDFDKMVPQMRDVLSMAKERMGEAARKGHVRALEQSLAPAPRREALSRLIWRVEEIVTGQLILPDCIAIASSRGAEYRPLIYVGVDETDAAIMPLSPDRLLVGQEEGAAVSVSDTINKSLAACSWDYFIARDKNPEFELMIPRIGEKTRDIHDDVVGSAIRQFDKPGE